VSEASEGAQFSTQELNKQFTLYEVVIPVRTHYGHEVPCAAPGTASVLVSRNQEQQQHQQQNRQLHFEGKSRRLISHCK
ncbi:hypothetical protein A6R68_11710, partial [Neotoma lepida]